MAAAPSRAVPEVFTAIQGGKLDPVYCFGGEERFYVDRCLAALRRAVLGADADRGTSFNLETFDLKERSMVQVLDAARTLPMFAKRRLILVRSVGEVDAEKLEPLLPYLADPNPSTCLVLVATGKVDTRLRAFQALRKAGYLHVFAHLRDRELSDWLRAHADERKVALDSDAAHALAESAGPDLARLALCLEQVALFAGPGVKLTRAHVETVVAESRERSIFELTKAIGSGNRDEALRLLGNMLRNREPALRIQFMLLRQLRQIWRAKELQAAGASRNDIAAGVGLPPFFVDDVLIPARRMTVAALERSFERLFQADRTLKSSRIDPDIQITRLVRALADDAAGPR